MNVGTAESLSDKISNELLTKPKPITVKYIPDLLLSPEETEIIEEENDELENVDVMTLSQRLF